MKSLRTVQALRRLRKSSVWEAIAADMAPETLGILQTHLYDKERQLPASTLIERVDLDLEEMRAHGDNLPQTAQQYLAYWYSRGFLRRFVPQGAVEEMYELSAAATDAIHFVQALERPQSSATESRLSIVMKELARLAEDTDTDKVSRLRRLRAERERIDAEIEAVECGSIRVLPHNVALERLREIANLSHDLQGDFRHVQDRYQNLHQELRENIMSHEGSRGDVLQTVFNGIRSIEASEPGRTFAAFWQLLNDPETSSSLDGELEEILSRKFAQELTPAEKSFLRAFKRNLLAQSDVVRSEFKNFTESLERYVRSTDYLEQRRMTALIKEAQRAAMAVKEIVKPYAPLGYSLQLTMSSINSMTIAMYESTEKKAYTPMEQAKESSISLAEIGKMFIQSDIDMRALRASVADVLKTIPKATIGDVLRLHPPKQGLGTIIGMIEIGSRDGVCIEGEEEIEWIGADNVRRIGKIPHVIFTKGKTND